MADSKEPIGLDPSMALVPGWSENLPQIRIAVLQPFWITTGHMTRENPVNQPVKRWILRGEICNAPLKLAQELMALGLAELAVERHIN